MDNIIYLDNNATTPIDPRVLEVMMPFFTSIYANSSSNHKFGYLANDAVKKARNQVAELIGAETNEIIFTSGATEAINLAIKGVAEGYQNKGKHIITVQTEHTAVLDNCRFLENSGYEVTYLPVQTDGLLDLQELRNAIRQDTILVSVMVVNNETGVIQPIKEIAEIAHEYDALFMTDATQAVGKMLINVDNFGIDLMVFSGHKLYGPKGIGALFIRQRFNRVKIPAHIHGGGHERGLRSGTLNVPGIVGLGKASELAKSEMKTNELKVKALRDQLEQELLQINEAFVVGNTEHRLYNVCNICFKGVDSDALILGLSNPKENLPMIVVSNGSACTSASIEPSHVLLAMGLSEGDAYSCVRFSVGNNNDFQEILKITKSLTLIINSLKVLAG
jgi:cysteine desulfurase